MNLRRLENCFFQLPSPNRKSIGITSIVLMLLTCNNIFAQKSYDWRTNVDVMIERADSLSMKSQGTFYQNRVIRIDKSLKNDRTVRETWYYTIKDGKIPIFQIRYLMDSVECNETYYLDNGSLVCLEQYESDFFSPIDEITWSKVLFFDNNTLKQHVDIGHRKASGQELTANDAMEVFGRRYTQLLRNLRANGARRL